MYTCTFKWKYDFTTLIYLYVKDVNSQMRGTSEFHENRVPTNSNDPTVHISYNCFIKICKLQNLKKNVCISEILMNTEYK